jgi:hypothetical protein
LEIEAPAVAITAGFSSGPHPLIRECVLTTHHLRLHLQLHPRCAIVGYATLQWKKDDEGKSLNYHHLGYYMLLCAKE